MNSDRIRRCDQYDCIELPLPLSYREATVGFRNISFYIALSTNPLYTLMSSGSINRSSLETTLDFHEITGNMRSGKAQYEHLVFLCLVSPTTYTWSALCFGLTQLSISISLRMWCSWHPSIVQWVTFNRLLQMMCSWLHVIERTHCYDWVMVSKLALCHQLRLHIKHLQRVSSRRSLPHI